MLLNYTASMILFVFSWNDTKLSKDLFRETNPPQQRMTKELLMQVTVQKKVL